MMKKALPLIAICIMIILATATGIFSRTSAPNIPATSLRGQAATYAGGGLYRFNPVSFAREGVIWDVVNLFIAVPLFIVSCFLALRGSLRGKLALGGLLAYFWYVYLGSSMTYAFNDFFLVYVGIFALCSVAFLQNLAEIDVRNLATVLGSRFPRRTLIVYGIAIAALLAFLWIGRAIGVMQTGRFPDEYAGITTLGSQALDLGLLVPLGLSTAILLWKRSSWGYYLASVTITIGFMMSIAIPSWATVPLIQDGKTNLIEAVPFYLLSVLGLVLAAIFYARVRAPSR